ncbi:MAG: nucleoside recognition domain-containing protein [Planctomycetota bacterium]
MTTTRPLLPRLVSACVGLLRQATTISWELIKIMVPLLVLTYGLERLGLIKYPGYALAPVMRLVGLPGEAGLVWAAAMITNLYGGIAAFVALAPAANLTTAQATVLCTMMAVAHALPVECRVCQKTGTRFRAAALSRIVGALLLGWILHLIYSAGGWLQGPCRVLWSEPPSDGNALGPWLLSLGLTLGKIYLIVLGLLALMKILEAVGLLKLLVRLMGPVLRRLGISAAMAPLAIIGMTMGVTYGGGLIIQETRTARFGRRNVVHTMTLMGLCHALIEDTLLMIALGAHVSGILWGRLGFSLAAAYVMVKLTGLLSDATFDRLFYRASAEKDRPVEAAD